MGRRAEFVRRRLQRARQHKQEGALRLTDGRAEWEGELLVCSTDSESKFDMVGKTVIIMNFLRVSHSRARSKKSTIPVFLSRI